MTNENSTIPVWAIVLIVILAIVIGLPLLVSAVFWLLKLLLIIVIAVVFIAIARHFWNKSQQ